MTTINRREFLDRSKGTGLGMAAGLTILANAKSVRGAPANDKITLGLVGAGGRGPNLANGFLDRGDCEFSHIADPNSTVFGSRAKTIAARQGGKKPVCVGDLRKVYDDKSVDAVVVATPDHWHALATVWACQAGKDVYVEKPPTQSCWEGQKMLEAARKYKRVVQCGFQNRSAPYNMAARKYIADGKLGNVHLCRIYNQKPPWGNCPVVADGDPPKGLNWDMWNGPAPAHKYNRSWHRCWHHQWRYSGGDIANDASHQIDLARWLLGVKYPKTVYSTGGRYAHPAAAQTPDTQVALYDFDKTLVSFELTLFGGYYPQDRRRRARQRHVPLLDAELDADRDLRDQGNDGRRPAWRRLAGLRTSEESQAGGGRPDVRPVPRSGAQGELRPVRPFARATKRRHRQGPPDLSHDPLRQP